MRTTNPALNDKTFAPERVALLRSDTIDGSPVGEVPTMTVGGVVEKSAFLLTLLVGAGIFGWSQVDTTGGVAPPGWLLVALFAGLGIAVLTVFKPKLARYTAPLYALVQGVLVGAISALFEADLPGIVVQAVGLTVAVFLIMLVLFALRIVKVTDKLRTGIMAATGAVMLVYLVSIGANVFFDAQVPLIHSTGPVGIGFSLLVVGIAAFNLLLDFDLIERGTANGAPAVMEWYAAFGLLVTLVWLYLELLRLLAKLRR